jgi:hypothetical protein
MKKQCPWCGKIYSRFKLKCSVCNADLITAPAGPSGLNGKRLYSDYAPPIDENYKYCPGCGEEYYGDVEICAECELKVEHKPSLEHPPIDETTKDFWKNKKDWDLLITPKTYQETFQIIRFLRLKEINALAAFIFHGHDPLPIIQSDIEKLERGLIHKTTYNPLPGITGRIDIETELTGKKEENTPIICILTHKKEQKKAREILKYDLELEVD